MSLRTPKRAAMVGVLTLLLICVCDQADAARIFLRHAGSVQGGSAEVALTAELGALVNMELVIDTQGENVTGMAVFLSFDSKVFRVIPSDQTTGQPFISTNFLDGLVLLNRIEEIEGETFLSYIEASGVQRAVGTGSGVVARFVLEVLRRPSGDLTTIAIEERGHDHRSHYVVADEPGTERRFEQPMGMVMARIQGFRILSLPDLVVVEGEEIRDFILVEGEPPRAFDLDDFVDQEGAQVLWANTILSELPTTIDPETNRVTMNPLEGNSAPAPAGASAGR